MDLPTMRARVRRDLRDEDATEERWSADELDRHLERALRELSLAAPREATATLQTTSGSRDLSIATLTERVSVDAVEYPTGQYPPSLVPFSVWEETLTLLTERVPGAAEDVVVRYSALHTIDGTSSTLPAAFEELLATGAAAYAALEWASFATNRVNVGGAETWRDYHTWAHEQLAVFAKGLAKHGRERRLRSRRMYRPAEGALGERPLGE